MLKFNQKTSKIRHSKGKPKIGNFTNFLKNFQVFFQFFLKIFKRATKFAIKVSLTPNIGKDMAIL